MDQGQKVTLTRESWSQEAEGVLMPAAFGDMDLVRPEVEQGVSQLWRLGGSAKGFLVTRQEGRELVLVMGAGKNAAAVIKHCLGIARKNNLTIRAHIRRLGMKRIYERAGFKVREIVMGAA